MQVAVCHLTLKDKYQYFIMSTWAWYGTNSNTEYKHYSLQHKLLLLLLLLHDLYSANFEDRVRGAGVARWRTWLTGEGEKVRF